jgi:hypothetical protein
VSDVMDDVNMTGTVVSAGNDSCAANQGESENRHTAAKTEVRLMAKPSDCLVARGPGVWKTESPAQGLLTFL